MMARIIIFFICSLLSFSAFAYLGPGVGMGAIATFIAILLAVVLVLVGFVWYPLKRLLKRQDEHEPESVSRREDD